MEQFLFYRKTCNGFLKKFWLFVFLTFFSLGVKAQCPTGNVSFLFQADVDAFATSYPNCTEITGNLIINRYVNNLNGLSNLETVGGNLRIFNNQNLTNLDGLNNLETVGGDFLIQLTPNLTNINGLSSLTSIGGELRLEDTEHLTNLDGLINLTSIGGNLRIQDNNALTDISGLQNIDPNSTLPTNGFALIIVSNSSLSVCNLPNFCTYLQGSGPRSIYNNAGDCISEAAVNAACTTSQEPQCPTGDVMLYSQAAVDAFAVNYPNCTQISGHLVIGALGGTDIVNLEGLSNVTSVGDFLLIGSNHDLTTLDGLNNLTSVGGHLSIGSNNVLTTLDGLSNLTSVGGNLFIGYTSLITTLDGLSNLESINGTLEISINATLTDISGLENIDPSTISGLTIINNANLSVCNIANFCTYLSNPDNPRTISDNAGDCISEAAVNAACNPAPPCDAPANLTVSGIIHNKATINWTNSGTFDLKWGAVNFTDGNELGTANGVTALNYEITGLTANTAYDVYVRQNCTANQSEWVKVTFNTIAQCPEGSVLFTSQAQVNTFATNYPNCTEISGYLYFYGNDDITDLSPLSNLTSVGGLLGFESNLSLTNLDGLSNLTSVGGFLGIYSNPNLTNISGLENITGFTELYIQNNTALSVCHITSVCAFLEGTGNRTISGNATGCQDDNAILANCPITAIPCDVPENLTVSGIINNKATINWTNSGTFDLKWGAENFTEGNELGTANGVTALNYEITGLTANTAYDVYVRQNCDVNQSEWVGPFAFTTLSQCPTGDVILGSQAEVDAFAINYPNCTEVSGNLTIQGANITDLSPLSNLTSIGGYLHIDSNSSLTNLDGLSNLTSIGGYLGIYNNSNLTTLDGLSALTTVGEDVIIWDNSQLTNLDGLSALITVGGALYIEGNSQLAVCNNAFVCNFSGTKYIASNASGCNSEAEVIAACFPCEIPSSITTSNITSNQATINWTNSGTFDLKWGAENFTEGNELGTANGVTALNYEITGLTANTAYDVYVRQNCDVNQSDWVKVTFTTLPLACPVGDVSLNTQVDVDAFLVQYPNCTHIDGTLQIGGVGSTINNLDGFSNIESIAGALLVLNNWDLENLDGLSSLITVIGHLQITNNFTLTDIDGLSNLTSLGADITIAYNDNLTSVSGLSGLTTINPLYNEGLRLFGNMSLTTCEIAVFCDYLSHSSDTHPREIHDNGTNCNDEAEIYAACNPPVACSDGDVYINSQEDLDDYVANYPLCTIINGSLFIEESDISDLSGLNNIETITGDVYITDNQQLTSLNGLTSLETIGGMLFIGFNFNMQDLDGLSSLRTIEGMLSIDSNPLENLNGLNALENIGDELMIAFTGLSNLDGLSNLTHLGADISIMYNDYLEDISGLSGLTTLIPLYEFGLQIFNNPLLSTCNLGMFCDYLSNDPETHPRWIVNNAGDCSNEEAVLEACEQLLACDGCTIWNGTSWSHGEPNVNLKAIIEGNLTITDSIVASELLINSGVLTVASGATLTITGAIDNTQNQSNFIVQSGANLIQVDDVQNIGAITVQRNAVIKHLDYTIWSSPVAAQGLQAFSPYTVANRIRIYDGDLSVNTWVVTTGDFAAGKGYMFRAPNVFDDGFYPNAYTWTGNFKGIPQNGAVTTEFTSVGKFQSLGNPYPSNIDRATFHQENPNIGALYFWTNSFGTDANGNYLGNNWKLVNILGESVSPTDGGNEPMDYIAVGQGFLARTYNDESQVVFNNEMRTTNNAVFYKTASTENHKYWLNLQQENQSLNQMLVSYNASSSNDLDLGIDASLFNYSGSAIYSLIENSDEKFAIQGRALPFNQNDIVPLGFKATQAGSYTISLSNVDGLFAEGQNIYLRDKFTQIEHDLKTSNYDFVSDPGTFNERFEVIYTTQSLSVSNPNLENSWIVYKNDNAFNILTQGFEIKDVLVYDMLGRVVYQAKDINSNQYQFNSLGANQVLIVKVITGDEQELIKKVN